MNTEKIQFNIEVIFDDYTIYQITNIGRVELKKNVTTQIKNVDVVLGSRQLDNMIDCLLRIKQAHLNTIRKEKVSRVKRQSKQLVNEVSKLSGMEQIHCVARDVIKPLFKRWLDSNEDDKGIHHGHPKS